MKKVRTLAFVVLVASVARLALLAPGGTGHLEPPWLERVLFAQTPSGFGNGYFFRSARLAADCTDGTGGTTLQNPCLNVTTNAGPQLALPANPSAQAYYLDCDVWYSQATNVADTYGVTIVPAPTSAQMGGWAMTNATTIAAGTPGTITSTTATSVVTFTPAVTTVLDAHLAGLIEVPAAGQDTIVSLLVSQATAANVVVTKRGSICRAWAVQ